MMAADSQERAGLTAGLIVVCALAALPLLSDGYYLSLGVNIMFYAAVCTAWATFSGPTNLVSLASGAFYGIGTYAVALGIDAVPFPILVVIGAAAAALMAGIVGMATLRLSGIYFVIFTLGLAELVLQLVSWMQSNVTRTSGLYVFTDMGEREIYWMLLALAAFVFATGWIVKRSRLGFALRVIGDDETVARHLGIDVARAKIALFMISGAFIGVAGALMAPRYGYIEPKAAFNPMLSFLVVIMALLGGTRRLWGPLVGVVPFAIVMDLVSANFPNHTPIIIGCAFLAIVYALPNGITGRLEQFHGWFHRDKRTASRENPA